MGCVSDQVVMWYYFAFTGRKVTFYAYTQLTALDLSHDLLLSRQDDGILFPIRTTFVESSSIQ